MPGKEKNNSQPCGGEEQYSTWLLPHGRKKKNPKGTHRSLGGKKSKQMGTWGISDVGLLITADEAGGFGCPFFCGFGFFEVWGWDGAAPWLLSGRLLLPSTL